MKEERERTATITVFVDDIPDPGKYVLNVKFECFYGGDTEGRLPHHWEAGWWGFYNELQPH